MKVIEAINAADRLKPNMYTLPDKIKWLSRLEHRIFNEEYLTHELSDEEMQPFLPDDEQEERNPEDEQGRRDAWHALEIYPPAPPRKRDRMRLEDLTPDDGEKVLLVGEPWDEMYVHWLSAQIDWYNMETDGFNNSNAMFESVYQDFCRAFNRSHMPLTERKIYY